MSNTAYLCKLLGGTAPPPVPPPPIPTALKFIVKSAISTNIDCIYLHVLDYFVARLHISTCHQATELHLYMSFESIRDRSLFSLFCRVIKSFDTAQLTQLCLLEFPTLIDLTNPYQI